MRSLNTGATGMMTQQLNVEVISNNIANMSTTAFKRQRAEFQDLLYQNLRRPGATSSDAKTLVPSGIQIVVGVRAGRCRAFLAGRFERDLRILLVEQILRPQDRKSIRLTPITNEHLVSRLQLE